ncbi:MAG: sugar ABC transporter ATP-binding protein [Acidobacteria bacterium]|nr:sugar ABC transporter ATP-binding protein [Acidobacteriota bacterium]
MRGIGKRYPGVVALDDVSLDLRAGEVHVLLGENGAGKSTLMKVLSGATTCDTGEVLLTGTAIDVSDPIKAQRHGIRAIYQELSLVPHLSVAENVFLGHAPRRGFGMVDFERMRADTRRVLESLGTSIDPDAPAGSLRLAQQQMVEIARALAACARIVIRDEPTAALSDREVNSLFDAIGRLTTDGVAVVYISHRMAELFRIGHRVTVMRDGRVVTTRPITDVTEPELVRLMANRDVSAHYPARSHARGAELLRVDDLHGGAIKHVSFGLYAGEILGIAGLVGAGRSRLVRAIAGAEPVAGGTITIRGTETRMTTPRHGVDAGIGFLPEDRKRQGLVLKLPVQHNIALSHLRQLSRAGLLDTGRERNEADDAIARLRIRTPGRDQLVVNLSGGNQQKVVLAKWLAAGAGIFIFDEPTRGIDVAARQEIYLLMNGLVEQGAGIIMVSSDMSELLGMSDRVLVMRGGAVQAELEGADATEARVLGAAFGMAS